MRSQGCDSRKQFMHNMCRIKHFLKIFYCTSDDGVKRRNVVFCTTISLIKAREFHRAAFFLEKIKDESAFDRFMYYWSRFLAYEHDRLENGADSLDRRNEYDDSDMSSLHYDLCCLGSENPESFDTFLHYVLGKVRTSLKLNAKAREAFTESIKANKAFWPSWDELVNLVESIDEIECEDYSKDAHWMYQFFKAGVLFRFQAYKNALEHYEKICGIGLVEVPFILNQVAASLNGLQEHEMATEFFEKVRKIDPLRIDQMHLYSDSLYVRNMRAELATLAHTFYSTHKFSWETCCIVANYYSLRGEHDKSVMFLQRSLKLNPYNASAWTLIGHEFMEQKNNSAACLAYRKAIEADPNDYRGWYGLGQLYDILKMPSYSLFYYQQAHKCKSDDSRMLVALGETYSRLTRICEAQQCFLKAFKIGDVDGIALILLGELYVKLRDDDQAALVYEKYLNVYGDEFAVDYENIAKCCRFLARYYLNKDDLDTATAFAQRCLEYDTANDVGRTVLRQISELHRRRGVEGSDKLIGFLTGSENSSAINNPRMNVTPVVPQIEINEPTTFRSPEANIIAEAEMDIPSDDESFEG